jgi:DNA-directed RNA polymerase specialized sigma24 family protein
MFTSAREPSADAGFLALLHEDPRAAEQAYVLLRRKLICFFRQRNCQDLENLADEVIHRAYRKWRSGAQIEALGPYCYGIARRVVLELPRSTLHTGLSEELPAPSPSPDRTILLRELLDRLPPRDRDMIAAYHQEDRRELAQSLGLSENALRIRAWRITEILRSLGRGRKNDVSEKK